MTTVDTDAGFVDVSRRFARGAVDLDPRELVGALAEVGWSGLLIDERYGGAGATLADAAAVAEATGRAALSSPWYASGVAAAVLIDPDWAGAPDLLAEVAAGRTAITAAVVEPGTGGGGPHNPTSIARPAGSGYQLSGTKVFVEWAELASAAIVSAQLDGAVALVRVPLSVAGVSTAPMATSSAEHYTALTLTEVAVDPTAVIARGASAVTALSRWWEVGATLKAAELGGLGQAALDLTVEFSRSRRQFGKPLGSFQAVQHHCADMLISVQQTRSLVGSAVRRLAAGLPSEGQVSMAKVKASEAIPAAFEWAHQVHGGIGYYSDYPLERYFRQMIAARATFGSSLWHRRRLLELLQQRPGDVPGLHQHRRIDGPIEEQ